MQNLLGGSCKILWKFVMWAMEKKLLDFGVNLVHVRVTARWGHCRTVHGRMCYWGWERSRTQKERTEPGPRFCQELNPNLKIKKCARTRTQPCPVKNQTEPKPKYHGSYWVLSLNEIVDTFTHFTVNKTFYFT